MTDHDLRKPYYCDFYNGYIDFYAIELKHFESNYKNLALKYAERGVNIMIKIKNKERLLILSK